MSENLEIICFKVLKYLTVKEKWMNILEIVIRCPSTLLHIETTYNDESWTQNKNLWQKISLVKYASTQGSFVERRVEHPPRLILLPPQSLAGTRQTTKREGGGGGEEERCQRFLHRQGAGWKGNSLMRLMSTDAQLRPVSLVQGRTFSKGLRVGRDSSDDISEIRTARKPWGEGENCFQ